MQKEMFQELLQNQSDALILDIREAEEVKLDKLIEGTIHMPMGKVFTEAAKGNLPKDKQIVVFCRTGVRAGIVVRELSERGHTVDCLEGGLNALEE